ncbi:MAG: DUF6722 family protein [bacterium]
MRIFTPKRFELLSKYFADISKLFFGAGVLKQFLQKEPIFHEILIGLILSLILLGVAFFLQPKE